MIKRIAITLALLASFSGLHSYFGLKIKPSMDLFSDNFGWNVNIGIENGLNTFFKSLPEGLYWGLSFNMFGASVTNLGYTSFNGGLAFGYRLNIGNRLLYVSPGLTAGGGAILLQNVLTNVGAGAFYLYPEIDLDFPLGSGFELGLNAGYRMYFLGLYNAVRMINSIQAGVGITFVFDSGPDVQNKKPEINTKRR